MFVIGIGGGSCAGKSTLSTKLQQALDNKALVLHLDSYYYDWSDIPRLERENINFDSPDAFDFSLLCSHIELLENGFQIESPEYDFVEHVRKPTTRLIEPKEIVIIEGILVLYSPALKEKINLGVFVDTDIDVRLIRRFRRELFELRNTFDSAANLYMSHTRKMHLDYVEPTKENADIVVSGADDNSKDLYDIISRISL